MQSILVYGRHFARCVMGYIPYDASASVDIDRSRTCRRTMRLVTASCGFSKDSEPNINNMMPGQVFKRDIFGDDAYFITKYKHYDVLGVADGVGGWRDYGIDPSQFPSQLMRACERLVRLGHFDAQSPVSVIASSYKELQESKSPSIGSSTACIVIIDNDQQTIHSANLGDSGFVVVRRGRVVHRSEEQQHYFNTPFQLSIAPPGLNTIISDSPESASSSSVPISAGDLVLMATDGLFDNMPDSLILSELAKIKDQTLGSIQQAVNSIAEKAREIAYDPSYMSPFAEHARENGMEFLGGKPDDITVLLSAVCYAGEGDQDL